MLTRHRLAAVPLGTATIPLQGRRVRERYGNPFGVQFGDADIFSDTSSASSSISNLWSRFLNEDAIHNLLSYASL
ncbi:hypothetical protein L1887_11607 [Cichorium endivia]|nr:hypothetical protein L1887_11607 [Cichorium endivia]